MSLFYELKSWQPPVDHVEKYGANGTALPNMKELTPAEFALHSYWTYTFRFYEWRQARNPEFLAEFGFKYGQTLHIWYFKQPWADGICMIQDYEGQRVRYFTFQACVHEMVDNGSRMCWHRSKCKKCGFEWEVDSSD